MTIYVVKMDESQRDPDKTNDWRSINRTCM